MLGAGLKCIEDLLYYFPRRYEDRRSFSSICRLQIGQTATIKAEVQACSQRRSFKRRGFNIQEAALSDGTGRIFCVWFNQPYLKSYFKPGQALIAHGKVELYGRRLQMNSPEFELLEDKEDPLSLGRITPVYRIPEYFSQRTLRKLLWVALEEYLPYLRDSIPYDIRRRNNLINLAQALLNIHFPQTPQLQQEAYRRLAFDEFFIFQLPLVLRKLRRKDACGIAHKTQGGLTDYFLGGLAFKLTQAQSAVINEISADMSAPVPMQRLLQGDVGSGKTVVALYACIAAIQGGYQASFMAPTEILARQHFNKISAQLASGGKGPLKDIKIGLLTASLSRQDKDDLISGLANGSIDLVIGTHSLLEEKVEFKNLGLVVIDEQHKFGVGQRALLMGKGSSCDALIMTATPIPRTLAITLYGELDISVINELPAGRIPVKTMRFGAQSRANAYELARQELAKGNQVFVVYPVIEDSFALDIAGAKRMFVHLKSSQFKDFRVGLVHGRLKDKSQQELMGKFRNKELDVLVATTVLEVGIDIPDATCMIIENAERFGLSQLHQLRGRVGRSVKQSLCLLVSDAQTDEANLRLEAMVRSTDGFIIAEEDLKIRGPGEFFGARQHGLSELRIGDPITQMHLLKQARQEALSLAQSDPHLESREGRLLKTKLMQRFPEYRSMMVIG